MSSYPRLTLAMFLLSTAAISNAETLVSDETPLATATFSMYCYWTGEATLGGVRGVVASRIGHWGGDEIVQVDYDPAQTSLSALIEALELQGSFDAIVVDSKAAEKATIASVSEKAVTIHQGAPRWIPPKHSLRTRHPALMSLELTEAQAIALNHWSYFGGPVPDVLTADQRRQLAEPVGSAP